MKAFLKNWIVLLFGQRIGNTRVVPVMSKILFAFAGIILVSNLSSNYINLIFNRSELLMQMRQLLAKDMESIYNFCNNQYEIYELLRDRERSLESITRKGVSVLKNSKSIALGVNSDGKFFFQASRFSKKAKNFSDTKALQTMKSNLQANIEQGFLQLRFNSDDYFAAYRYNKAWDTFIVLAEEEEEFYGRQSTIFWTLSGIILLITLVSVVVGIYLLSHILSYLGVISASILKSLETQQLQAIDLKKAPNDDITFLGIAINSLISTVTTLISIFQKFTSQDIVRKVYREHEVRLEGEESELTILFSDVRRFTYITEVLGPDIINLLNLYYDRAIRQISSHNGMVGSIIGDALLAVYGVPEIAKQNDKQGKYSYSNKSQQAIVTAYKLHEEVGILRNEMQEKRDELLRERTKLSPEEERIYQATLLNIGVGIDGGRVFYGTLGSQLRMTNTVIGDNVNASSRLEGLTRVYNVPVICSQYVKKDVQDHVMSHDFHFLELDRVRVKGKEQWQKIYWPIFSDRLTKELRVQIKAFSQGLEAYYAGDWQQAHSIFSQLKLAPAEEFAKRTVSLQAPQNWSGIWQMTTK